jgi:hypothetical protein
MLRLVNLLIFITPVIFSQACNKATRTISDTEKAFIVDYHNMYRNQIATQTNTVGLKMPYATNMLQFYWNDALAQRAQDWANNCLDQHSTQYFREQPEYTVGENLFHSWSLISYPKLNLQHYIDVWFNEIALGVDLNIIGNFVFSELNGHFTEMIWANTNQIGCGFSQYKDGKFNTLVVCHYGRAGNIEGLPMYAPAPTVGCNCPQYHVCGNSKYTGLCCEAPFCNTLYSTPIATTTTSTTTTTTTTAVPANRVVSEEDVSSSSDMNFDFGKESDSYFYAYFKQYLFVILLLVF